MMVSSLGEAAQISSTLIRPRAVSIWASMPMCPRARPAFSSTWVSRRSSATTSARRLDLGQHDLVQALAGVAHHLNRRRRRSHFGVPGVDPHAQDPVAPGQVLDGVGTTLGRALSFSVRGDYASSEVEEGHVGRHRRGLGQELLVRSRRRQTGAAGQVTGACRHDHRVTNGPAGPASRRPPTGSSSRRLLQRRAEERQAALPQQRGRPGVVDLRAGVVEEGVVSARVDVDLHVLAQSAQLLRPGPHPLRA